MTVNAIQSFDAVRDLLLLGLVGNLLPNSRLQSDAALLMGIASSKTSLDYSGYDDCRRIPGARMCSTDLFINGAYAGEQDAEQRL